MACNFLTVLGFNCHLLKAEFRKKKELAVELVTISYSKEPVEALVKASAHGAVFAVMGGHHFTLDNMLTATKLLSKKIRIEELKQDTK